MSSNRKKQNRKRTWRAVLIVLAVYCALLAAFGFLYDGRHAELEMLGSRDVVLEYGQTYTDAGAVAYTTGRLFDGEDLSVNVEGPTSLTEVGEYSIEYSCTFRGKTITDTRRVSIVDTVCPVLTLVPNGLFNARATTGFEEPGYSAQDNHDGDITSRVNIQYLNDKVIYTVSDSSGNSASAEREIIYAPTEPTILLEGGDSVTIDACISYRDPGYYAFDSQGNDVSSKVERKVISVDGKEVNGKNAAKVTEFTPYLPGTYVLRYSFEAAKNISITCDRTVTVVPVEMPQSVEPGRKTVYLTFDDGPGPYTEQLLDVLAKYDVKATFFVTGQNPDYYHLMTREAQEGHTVAVHTFSHDCYSHGKSDIYSSVEAYYNDFMAMRELIFEYTGVYTDLFRFPGGSSNTISAFNPGIMTTLTKAMPAMGFKYFDWNASSGDASSYKYTSQRIFEMATTGAEGIEEEINTWGYAILLQHDLKDFSVGAVESIIRWGLAKGYTFAALDMTSPRARHGVFN